MAITIEQKPRLFSVNNHDLVVVAASDNVAETGFRFRVHVGVDISAEEYTLFVPPNTDGSLVVNIRQLLAHHTLFTGEGIYNTDTFLSEDDSSRHQVDVTLSEWWLVDGVLTENAGSEVNTDLFNLVCGYFDNKQGFNPDTNGSNVDVSFALNGNTKRMMSDRKYDTHIWDRGASFGVTPSTQTIYIPCFENDWGVLNYATNGGNGYLPAATVAKINLTLYDSSGAPHGYTENIFGAPVDVCFCYPANLNANTVTAGLPKPSDYPNWRFYTVRGLTSADAPASALYVFYNASLYGQTDCKYDRIRIAFAGSRGGWEFQNFIKRNEESLNIERKSYTKVRGNYGSATDSFSYSVSDSGRTTIAVTAKKSITVNSDWISENEFIFLQSLLVSNTIHWVQDDGTFFPVQIEATDYTLSRERNGKLKNVSFKFTMANDYI